MKRFLLLVLPVLLFALPGSSATKLGSSYGIAGGAGVTYLLCNSETDTGVCDSSTGSDHYIDIGGMRQFTVMFSEVGTGSTCDVYVQDQEFAQAVPDDLDTYGHQLNSVSLSATVPILSYELPVYLLWIKCTIVGTSASVSVQASL